LLQTAFEKAASTSDQKNYADAIPARRPCR